VIILSIMVTKMSVPWLVLLLTSLLIWRPRFCHQSVCVGFLVGNVALGQVFLLVLQFSPVTIIPPVLHSHSFICHLCYIFLAVDSMFVQHAR
jgi:hypothetical protein